VEQQPDRPLTNEEQDRAGEIGARTVRAALERRIRRRIERGADDRDYVALLLGALIEIAQMLAVTAKQDEKRKREAEEIVIAHVRATFRDELGPINEDGSHYGDW
jgi:hypothetical protein